MNEAVYCRVNQNLIEWQNTKIQPISFNIFQSKFVFIFTLMYVQNKFYVTTDWELHLYFQRSFEPQVIECLLLWSI